MNRIFLLVWCIGVIGVGCRENSMVFLGEAPLSLADSLRAKYLKPAPTAEPYRILEDPGLEAELIALGWDTDKQINGKLSEADARKIKVFGLPKESESPVVKERYELVLPLLRESYLKDTGKELKVGSLADLRHLTALEELYIHFEYPLVDTLDLSAHPSLVVFSALHSNVKVVDIRGCAALTRMDMSTDSLSGRTVVENVLLPSESKLQYMAFRGKVGNLDLSGAKDLQYLGITIPGNEEPGILDLCHQTELADMSITGIAGIRLSAHSVGRLEASRADHSLRYFREFLNKPSSLEIVSCDSPEGE